MVEQLRKTGINPEQSTEPERFTYRDIAEWFGIEEISTVTARCSAAIRDNPSILTDPESIAYKWGPGKRSLRSFTAQEVERLRPFIESGIRHPFARQALQDSREPRYSVVPVAETVSDDFDSRKALREITDRQDFQRLQAANLGFTNIVLGHIEVEALAKLSRDPQQVHQATDLLRRQSASSDHDADTQVNQLIIDTAVEIINRLATAPEPAKLSVKERQILSHFEKIAKEGHTVDAIAKAIRCHFKAENPPEFPADGYDLYQTASQAVGKGPKSR